jgi:hypothetical protein
VRDVGDGALEGGHGVPVRGAHRDEDQRLEGEAESLRVELRVVAADHARPLQGAQPAVAGRDAQPDALGQLGDRQPTVLDQLGKDSSVHLVHVEDPAPNKPPERKVWKHLREKPT